MSHAMQLKLTLRNGNTKQALSLTSLAPQTGWDSAPPHHLAGGDSATCTIETSDELAITLCYGPHHIGIRLGDGKLSIDPGDAMVEQQRLDGYGAEVALVLM